MLALVRIGNGVQSTTELSVPIPRVLRRVVDRRDRESDAVTSAGTRVSHHDTSWTHLHPCSPAILRLARTGSGEAVAARRVTRCSWLMVPSGPEPEGGFLRYPPQVPLSHHEPLRRLEVLLYRFIAGLPLPPQKEQLAGSRAKLSASILASTGNAGLKGTGSLQNRCCWRGRWLASKETRKPRDAGSHRQEGLRLAKMPPRGLVATVAGGHEMKRATSIGSTLVAMLLSGASLTGAREITFEERVEAQRAIERVYYSHQIGATKLFEEAVPRRVIEGKVRNYLKQSVALERLWETVVTAEMLRAELDRMARGTRMPERLRELRAALGDDPFLVQECLVRPILTERLVRNFFAFDERIHAKARSEAEELRQGLMRFGVKAFDADPRRSEVEIRQTEPTGAGSELELEGDRHALELSPDEFAQWRESVPALPGEIGVFREDRDAIRLSIVAEEGPDGARLITFTVPKIGWDDWWQDAAVDLDEASVQAVASEATLPISVSPLSVSTVDLVGGSPGMELDVTTIGSNVGDAWDNGSLDDAPDPRTWHTAVWTGSEMLVWGGIIYDLPLNSGYRYEPATDSWKSMSTVDAPKGRMLHTAVWTGTQMVVWGGIDDSFDSFATGGRYDPATDAWAPTALSGAPSPRSRHTAVWTGSAMLVWGGVDYDSFDNGRRYDPHTDTWAPISTVGAPSRRFAHTAVWTGTEMVVWGGYGAQYSIVDTGGRYDPSTDRWQPTSTVGVPARRAEHTAVWTGSRMVVWAGGSDISPNFLNTGGQYDPSTDTWSPTSTTGAPLGRWKCTAVWTGDQMVVWGGSTGTGTYVHSTGGRYDPTADRWTPTSNLGAPSARVYQTAVWTGSQMVVWGGLYYNFSSQPRYASSGGRYDPRTDSWTPTSTGSAPSGRTLHTAIWTGNQMVVWGGSDALASNVSTGGRYDPVVDNWTPTSALGAPSGRLLHTAIWTGNQMVVWGGDPQRQNTGGRYDPIADTWSPTSTTGAPSGRASHTAVWTGSKMVIWGGIGFSYLNTGGRYDPAADTWTPTSTEGAPSARTLHTAVWAGNQMVIWGGYSPSSSVNTGGRYDAEADSWRPTSVDLAPSRRTRHTAVWTGTEMVVWGGQVSGLDYQTAGRYDPMSDSWGTSSADGAPSRREVHTAVWTGRSMVVWGGEIDGVNTGGRYEPGTDTWTATSLLKAPHARGLHTAVWTGQVMIVWGGAFNGNRLGTGGRYLPEANHLPIAAAGSDQTLECQGQRRRRPSSTDRRARIPTRAQAPTTTSSPSNGS